MDLQPANSDTIHIFFFPNSGRGHTIPLVETARLFAQRPGVRCSFVTTPGNSSYILPTIEDAKASGHRLDLLLLQPFPYAEVGLPAGVECSDSVPSASADHHHKIGMALFLLRNRLKDLIAEHRPDCIVSDSLFCWTADVALSLSVPHIVFSVFNAFSKSVTDHLFKMNIVSAAGAIGPLTGLPHPLELTSGEIPLMIRLSDWMGWMAENERKSCGFIFNTFYELESEYVDHFARNNLTGTTMKVWCVGPVQLYKSIRAATNELEQDGGREIKDWLDSKEPESVLYVCFGTECFFSHEQLIEIAIGLQSCKHCFIWVVRGRGGGDTIQEWLPREFHETKGDRGLILTEWAPQVAILNHTATGGFLTHCGGNSAMEAVCAGLPVIAWPLHSDHFLNERLMVEILGIGVRILHGAEMRSVDAEGKGVVKGEVIRDAVDRLMGGGDEEVRAMRANANKYQDLARSAMEEGGSSYINLCSVIELIKEKKKEKNNKNENENENIVQERGTRDDDHLICLKM